MAGGQMSTIFPASYGGTCGCCGEYFAAGTNLRYSQDGRLVVDGCPHSEEDPYSEAQRAAARAAMCGKCFTVHGAGQKECW